MSRCNRVYCNLNHFYDRNNAVMGSFTICNSSRDRKLFPFILIPFGHKCSAQNKCIQMETRCLDETTGWFQFCVYELHTRRFLSLSTVSCGVFKYINCIHWRQWRRIMIPYRAEKDWCSKYVRKNCKTCLFRRLFILIEINVLTWPSRFVKGLKMLYSVTKDTKRLRYSDMLYIPI